MLKPIFYSLLVMKIGYIKITLDGLKIYILAR